MATPIIHIAGGSLVYLLLGDLSIDRIYIILGVILLSTLPDFDFLIPGPHRGFSHSLLFSGLVALVVGSVTPISYLTSFGILVSHLFLDSMSDGWYSVSWLWPIQYHHSPVSYTLTDVTSFIKDSIRIF